jgi:hypothetical protein
MEKVPLSYEVERNGISTTVYRNPDETYIQLIRRAWFISKQMINDDISKNNAVLLSNLWVNMNQLGVEYDATTTSKISNASKNYFV